MSLLNKLRKLLKKRKRVGRGGERGGTSGRGHKGQKARSGPGIGFVYEGGQMPLPRRLPKRGFNNANFRKAYDLVNLDSLERGFDEGATVTRALLIEKGFIKDKKSKNGQLIKIAGSGTLTKKMTVHADAFTQSAQKAIEGCGGKVAITQ